MTRSTVREGLEDVAVGAVSGYVATKIMEPVSSALYRWEPDQVRDREDRARPGPPFQIAADKTTARLGLELTEQQRHRAGLLVHYGLAMSWAPLYAVIRRRWHTPIPVTALAVGAAMSAIVDETLTPLLGFSAPNRAYPLPTHLRSVLAHLAFGAATAAVTETAWALRSRRP